MSAISRLTGFILLFSFATPGQERPLALFTETLKPILETPRRSLFLKSHSRKEVTDLLCLQDSLSTAEPIIPLLRTFTPCGYRSPRGQRPQHAPRGGRQDRPDRRQPRDTRNYENRSRAIDDAFHAPLDSVQLNSLIFFSVHCTSPSETIRNQDQGGPRFRISGSLF